jgi:aldose sugar dehydrogenase
MKKLLLLILCAFLYLSTSAQLTFSTRVLKDSLFIPWELVYGPDNHIWFTQKNGFICRMDTAGKRVDTLYSEPNTVTIKESGMLGMALHPDFFSQPFVYIVWEYRNPNGDIRARLERYTYSFSANVLSAPLVLLDSTHGFLFHNGSRIAIVGNKMFISVGDAADFSNAQNINTINGKIIRLNLDGSIPADNPFPGNPVWSWGHRNPQGMVYANNMLYSSEHGPDTDDEINIIKKGRNYGWPIVTGFCDQPAESAFCRDSNVAEPIYAWTPTIAPCGIDYYHHPMFPMLQNSLLLCTLKDQHLYQLQLNDSYDGISKVSVIEGFNYGRLRDLCISPDGKIFVSTSNSSPQDTGAKTDRIIVMYDPGYRQPESPLLIYPNPAKEMVHFFVPGAYTALHYRLSAMDGRKISEGQLPAAQPQLNVSALAAGLYHITIEVHDNELFTGDLLIAR